MPALAAHLAGGVTTLCHCWKLAPINGAVLGFTDHDRDVIFDGVTFEAQAGFDASEIESSLGLSVDNLEAAGALDSSRLTAEKLRSGHFDHAEIEIWRVNWQDASQRLLIRKGHLGEVSHGGAGFAAEVRGLSHVLNQQRGRLFQFGCDAALGDARCGVDLETAAFRAGATVLAAEENRRLIVSGLSGFADGWFSQGTLTWTTGLNAGRLEEVKFHLGDSVELWQAASFAVAIGDACVIRAGCDKQFATCKAKFLNTDDFRGFPHLPGPDFVTAFAAREDQSNDGRSRL
jgi:uncharacterized phage protein (TIGR02218 family)